MTPLDRANLSLDGLSVGDAFGERFFAPPASVNWAIAERATPASPWKWTDDTAMAISVVETLRDHGRIDRDALARAFGVRYRQDPHRCYGATAHEILEAISKGEDWREASGRVFDGHGSMGNGGGMRAAPIGGFFADDLDRVIDEARASAEPTHAHPDGQAGAIAVAAAAALAWRERAAPASEEKGLRLLESVIGLTPRGETRDVLLRSLEIPFGTNVADAAAQLGNGSGVISSDTVPLALWCAARHLGNFEEAMWQTVSALGDRDTTCAIAGGVVALAVGREGIPPEFLVAREPLW
ncbi:MAG: ADP-ribosylglycohydrolase family protein [Phycisphaerales bacterium]